MNGNGMPRPNRKEERNRRLEEQLRDNLRKRKELSRARKASGSRDKDDGDAPEGGPGHAVADD